MNPFGENIETIYPSWLLGFITSNCTREVVIQCLLKPLSWEDIQQNFVVDIEIVQIFDVSFVFVPIELIVHPLCVIPDNGDNINKYFVVLPKQNRSCFLGTISIDECDTYVLFTCEEFPNWQVFAVIGGITPISYFW
jgi:hypothetical protein